MKLNIKDELHQRAFLQAAGNYLSTWNSDWSIEELYKNFVNYADGEAYDCDDLSVFDYYDHIELEDVFYMVVDLAEQFLEFKLK